MTAEQGRERNGRLAPPAALTTLGTPTRPDTLTDRREFLSAGLRPVRCASCGTEVLVKKNSPKHTSIQWTSDASATCPVFAEQGGSSARLDTCTRLAESIRRAAREGAFDGR